MQFFPATGIAQSVTPGQVLRQVPTAPSTIKVSAKFGIRFTLELFTFYLHFIYILITFYVHSNYFHL